LLRSSIVVRNSQVAEQLTCCNHMKLRPKSLARVIGRGTFAAVYKDLGNFPLLPFAHTLWVTQLQYVIHS